MWPSGATLEVAFSAKGPDYAHACVQGQRLLERLVGAECQILGLIVDSGAEAVGDEFSAVGQCPLSSSSRSTPARD